jgi:DNA-binding NarL/FixJ family response regulator
MKLPSYVQEKAALADRDLSVREQQVVVLMADGFTSQQIADRLALSLEQVKHSMKNLQTKLGVQGRIQVVAAAIRRGLIP